MSGLRERKKVQTRADLSWAAVRLCIERGFDNVRVEEIAEEAGVSPRTFNNYFSSKAEAVVARHLDRCLRVADDLRARPAAEPLWQAIRHAARVQFDVGPELTANPVPVDAERWRAGLRVLLDHPAMQGEFLRASAIGEREIAAVVAERTGTDAEQDLYPRLVAGALMAVNHVVMQTFQARGGRPVPIDRLLDEALDLLTSGLREP